MSSVRSMLPLGILNASTRKVLMPKNNTTEMVKIFAQSHRKPSPARPRLTCCSASSLRSGVINRCNDGCIGSGDPSMATCTINSSPRGAASTPRTAPGTRLSRGSRGSCRSAPAATRRRNRSSRPSSPSRTRRPPSHPRGVRSRSALPRRTANAPLPRWWERSRT